MAYDFDKIARDYDRMNHLMTLDLDRWWRRRAVRELSTFNFQLSTLDVACGTGDMAVELLKHGCRVTGVDLSEEMLSIARRKNASANFQLGNAEALPFADGEFDAVTCAFGVRNFVHLEQGLNDMLRVLKPGGRMVILELATPDNIIIKPFYNLYTKHIIPWLGKLVAGNREAYTYLPQSIERFPKGKDFLKTIQHSSSNILHSAERKLTFGVCRMYTVVKN
ncbi:MAG: bifunctional demethylmenaquinone methyltransferase/2-methoxy-6-polyprenyl-1,4-benzoquinol methylase UbiE [Bacteroidales bacterium]|nr:bifunctional demethylmenaquinone methyltransferase/2-methoxy-6-polyprenyl-1,4-benzoquinol methylase UbiE [Bacteroidales bacterium]